MVFLPKIYRNSYFSYDHFSKALGVSTCNLGHPLLHPDRRQQPDRPALPPGQQTRRGQRDPTRAPTSGRASSPPGAPSGASGVSRADTFSFLFFFPVTSVTFLFCFAILQQTK